MANLPHIPGAPPPLLINVRSACQVLAIGRRKLWSLTICNAIPSRRIGRSVRYNPAELRAWIEAGCPLHAGAADEVRDSMGRGEA